MLKKNDIVTLTITDLTPEGAGVGKYEGYVVFVPKTAVGDMISARILKTLSSHGYGKCEEVLTASPDRREPDCAVFSQMRRMPVSSYPVRCGAENQKKMGGGEF